MNARRIPYGYKMEKGIISVNETEAEQVRRIFEMRLNGTGVYANWTNVTATADKGVDGVIDTIAWVTT